MPGFFAIGPAAVEAHVDFGKDDPQTDLKIFEFTFDTPHLFPHGGFRQPESGDNPDLAHHWHARHSGGNFRQNVIGQHGFHLPRHTGKKVKAAGADGEGETRRRAHRVVQAVRPLGQQGLFAVGGIHGQAALLEEARHVPQGGRILAKPDPSRQGRRPGRAIVRCGTQPARNDHHRRAPGHGRQGFADIPQPVADAGMA